MLGVGPLGGREPEKRVSHQFDLWQKGVCLRRSQLLDAEAGEPLTHVNALLERLALDDTSGETTSESVAIR